MLNHVLRAILASAICATAFILCSRADAMMVGNPAGVMAAAAATNFAQREQVRVSCNRMYGSK
jgi:uncharacterized cupredoxin-like copper-binding protein